MPIGPVKFQQCKEMRNRSPNIAVYYTEVVTRTNCDHVQPDLFYQRPTRFSVDLSSYTSRVFQRIIIHVTKTFLFFILKTITLFF